MSIEAVRVVVNDKTFSVNPLTGTKGFTAFKKLTSIVGPALAKVMGAANDEGVEVDVLAEGLTLLVENFEDSRVEELAFQLLGTVLDETGQPLNVDLYFAANYGEMFGLLAKVIDVNFSSAFTVGGFDQLLSLGEAKAP